VIRPAGPGDLVSVETVVRDAYTPWIARIGRAPAPMDADYAALIAAGQVHVLDVDGAVQGVLVLIEEAAAMLLDNVAIAPGAQGRGYGGLLLDHAEGVARAAGLRTIRLYTNQAMLENIAIYARRGYQETGRGEVGGLRRVDMSKPLG
jgi:GNAT superfamily N-acetyltransferase